ncbi:MAG: methyl-accepting chemotaxis protein [Hydrogenobaculum sp.]
MKRLSSLEKIQYANILSIVIFTISLAVEVYQYGLFDVARILNIFNFLAAWFIFVNIRKVQSFIKDTASVLKQASDGELTNRITTHDAGELELLRDSVNSLLNQIESFIIDLTNIIKAASSKNTDVKIDESIFKGSFSEVAKGFKELLNLIDENERFMERARFSQELSKIGGGISSNLKLIEKDIKNIFNKLNVIKDQSAQTSQLSKDATKDVEDVVKDLQNILEDIKNSNESIQALISKTESITKILSVIREIADQTNMLSLNAAIEAARAGEQGRGFAVVAEEVRKLSTKTQKATDDIAKVITELQIYNKEASNRIDEMIKSASLSTKSIYKLKDVIEEFDKSAEYNANLVLYLSDVAGMLSKKISHIIFKHQTFTSVYINKLTFDYKDENSCECGIWYNSENANRFRKYNEFNVIGELHKEFHNLVYDIVSKINKGEDLFNYKEQLLDTLNRLENLSREMFEYTDKIVENEEKEMLISEKI